MSKSLVPVQIKECANDLTNFIKSGVTGISFIFSTKEDASIVAVNEEDICGWDEDIKCVRVMTTEDEYTLEYQNYAKIVMP